jgi:hypothetical protein
MKISNNKLKMMRDYLPQGSNKIIADITGFSPVYISKVLHGVHLNIQVIEEAIKIATDVKTKTETLTRILDNSFK